MSTLRYFAREQPPARTLRISAPVARCCSCTSIRRSMWSKRLAIWCNRFQLARSTDTDTRPARK